MPLPSGNTVKVKPVDLMGLIMSGDNASIPNGLLDQLSAQLSGQAPDRELVCVDGYQLPQPGEPCEQGAIRGTVVSATGTVDRFTVRVSMISAGTIQPGEVRFGGMNMAKVRESRQWTWRLGDGDPQKAREELPQMGALIELIVRAAVVEPRLVVEVNDPETELAIQRVSSVDRMAIFQWAMPTEVRPAGSFPAKPAAGVAAASDVQNVSSEPGD